MGIASCIAYASSTPLKGTKLTTQYDSAFEKRIAPIMEALGFIRCDDYYIVTFQDKKGKTFHAKADWYHPGLKLYVETKCHALNGKTSLETAQNAEQRQRDYRRLKGEAFGVFDQLLTQWCHSKHKQAIVQRTLTPQQMIVVFEKSIPFEEMKAYKKAGLVCISLADLRTYKAYLHFAQRGLYLSFNYEYYEQSASFVL